MNRIRELLSSPKGQVLLLLMVLAITGVVMWLIRDNRREARQAVKQIEPVKLVVDTSRNLFGPSGRKDESAAGEKPPAPSQEQKQQAPAASPAVSKDLRSRESERFSPTPAASYRRPERDVKPNQEPLPLTLYTAGKRRRKPTGAYAAYGRLIKCELINTVATSNLYTPIIGLVTEGLWWNGKQIIPAGVEVHGVAANSPARDRIGAGTRWVLVWPHRRDDWNGKEMILDAIVLCSDRTASGWSKDDGSAGIKGRVISSREQQQMYAFIASFISGLGEGLISSTDTTTGSSTRTTYGGTWKDALGSALKDSFKTVLDQVLQDLSKNMVYVEADAGTEFYLYVRQVIDADDADLANTNAFNPTGRKVEVRNRR